MPLIGALIHQILLNESTSTQSAFQLRFYKEDPIDSASTQLKNTRGLLLRIRT
jgi:hypothetical protein